MSWGHWQRQALQGEADGVDGADRAPAAGFDAGAEVGVEVGAPLASEAVGDLPIDGAGAHGALRAVVGRADLAVVEEDERVGADLLYQADGLAAGVVGGSSGEDGVETPLQVGSIGLQRGVGEFGASAADGAGALQQCYEGGATTVSPASTK